MTFLEDFLRDNLQLQKQVEEMQGWVAAQLFGRELIPRNGREVITWIPPDSPQDMQVELHEHEIACSEEEMLKPDRNEGDRVVRGDLNQTFIFMGGNPLDPDRYFRLLAVNSELQMGSYEVPRSTCDREIARAFGVPSHLFQPPSFQELESALQEVRHPLLPSSTINPATCKFYSGNTMLRCAVNPSAPTCQNCRDFERKIETSKA